jgi:hypothetical protein
VVKNIQLQEQLHGFEPLSDCQHSACLHSVDTRGPQRLHTMKHGIATVLCFGIWHSMIWSWDNGGSRFLWNVGTYTTSRPRRQIIFMVTSIASSLTQHQLGPHVTAELRYSHVENNTFYLIGRQSYCFLNWLFWVTDRLQGRVLFKSQQFLRQSRNYPFLMEQKDSLFCWQPPSTGVSLSDESNSHPSIVYFLGIHFNTILLSMLRSSKQFLSFRVSLQNHLKSSRLSHKWQTLQYIPPPLIWLI